MICFEKTRICASGPRDERLDMCAQFSTELRGRSKCFDPDYNNDLFWAAVEFSVWVGRGFR